MIGLAAHHQHRHGDLLEVEVAAFLARHDLHLVGDTYERFIKAFVQAKEDAEAKLLRKAKGVYDNGQKAAAAIRASSRFGLDRGRGASLVVGDGDPLLARFARFDLVGGR